MFDSFFYLQLTLKLDPETEIKKFGPKPGPLDEIEVSSQCLLLLTQFEDQTLIII